MEKLDGRLFCAFLAFVALLLSRQVSTAEEQQTFASVMKSDEKLCESSNFLYNSSLTKVCRNTEYPTKALKVRYENWNTFMCLLVYDTWYRLCSYSNHWHNPFNTTATFDAYIENFGTIKEDTDKEAFCKNMQRLTPAYEKTKQLVFPILHYLNDTRNCTNICFALADQLNPLCSVLAWVKNIDEGVRKTTVSDSSTNQAAQTVKKVADKAIPAKTSDPQDKSKADEAPPQAAPTGKMQSPGSGAAAVEGNNHEKISERKGKSGKVEDNGGQSAKNLADPIADPELSKSKPPEADSDTVNADSKNTQVKSPGPAAPKGSGEQQMSRNENSNSNVNNNGNNDNKQVNQDVNNADNEPKNFQDNTDDKENSQVTNKEMKNSISDNTQDVAVGQDNSRLENDPYDPDDTDQPADPSDQNPNVPEPSEQRDALPQYHSIRPEEESHFLTYFTVLFLFCIAGYIGYHNKQKILAIVVEGRRSRNSRNRRRPSTASYRKLDCTLEEAVTSQCNANVTHVIY